MGKKPFKKKKELELYEGVGQNLKKGKGSL